jgi:NDP-sugar pyrophosphorylase family protein
MSKALLICPSERPAVAELSRVVPLAAAPLLGQSLLEYWLTHLALSGVKEVHILADDRVDEIKKIAGVGARWGLNVEVTAEVRELTAAQAQIKYATEFPAAAPNNISVLDHFPGEPNSPIFSSYANLFSGVMRWMPRANTLDRVGFREVQPGVWVGRNAHVSPEAQLTGPCWIGQHVFVGAKCVIGPNAILEDRSFIEGGADIVNSVIGPDTFVGKLAALRQSFAWGNTLVNWKSGSVAQIKDSFLMCALKRQPNAKTSDKFLGRLFELLFTEPKPEVDPLETINQQGKFT